MAALFGKSPGGHDVVIQRIDGMVYRDRTARNVHVSVGLLVAYDQGNICEAL